MKILSQKKKAFIFQLYLTDVIASSDWISGGEKIITGSWDTTIKCWNLENGKAITEFNGGHESPHFITNINTFANFFISSSSDGYFRGWDIRTSQSTFGVNAHSGYAKFSTIQFLNF